MLIEEEIIGKDHNGRVVSYNQGDEQGGVVLLRFSFLKKGIGEPKLKLSFDLIKRLDS